MPVPRKRTSAGMRKNIPVIRKKNIPAIRIDIYGDVLFLLHYDIDRIVILKAAHAVFREV